MSAAALLWPQGEHIAQVAESAQARVASATVVENSPVTASVPPDSSAASTPAIVLPSKLMKATLQPASFDPFVGVVPPPPAAPPPPPPVQVVQAPPTPVAPTLNYRYLGKMTDPAGRKWVYLATPDRELAVAQGTQLDEGYVVEAIRADGVHLTYPPLGTKALIPLPERATP